MDEKSKMNFASYYNDVPSYYDDVQLTIHIGNVITQPSVSKKPKIMAETVPNNIINLIIPDINDCLNIHLSKKEACILVLTAEGKTSLEIASALHISVNTVNFHIRNCLIKLRARNKTHAVAKAVLLNLLNIQ
jgi:DNA-binding CsgD family transcriptional regulator